MTNPIMMTFALWPDGDVELVKMSMSPTDPDFQGKWAALQALGFTSQYDSLAEMATAANRSEIPSPDVVTLDVTDPDFKRKKDLRKSRGHERNKDNPNFHTTADVPFPGRPLPDVVTLDKSDPDFFKKKEQLKTLGYKFYSPDKTWRLPKKRRKSKTAQAGKDWSNWWGDATEVELSKDDPNFQAKYAALKAAGGKWDGVDEVWVLPQNDEEAPI